MTAHFNPPPALVLNADFQPLSIYPLSTLDWQDAVRGVVQGKFSVVAEYDQIIRSQKVEMFCPSVIALREYQRITHKVAFTRINVFLRDHFQCQYCGGAFSSRDLTFEHVVPRSRGGRTTWENIVAACEPCNTRKGSHMHMKPLTVPRKPTVGELRAAGMQFQPQFIHRDWLSYLYWETPLEA